MFRISAKLYRAVTMVCVNSGHKLRGLLSERHITCLELHPRQLQVTHAGPSTEPEACGHSTCHYVVMSELTGLLRILTHLKAH